jgi:tetratricopeptide (TPR) repeat protein
VTYDPEVENPYLAGVTPLAEIERRRRGPGLAVVLLAFVFVGAVAAVPLGLAHVNISAFIVIAAFVGILIARLLIPGRTAELPIRRVEAAEEHLEAEHIEPAMRLAKEALGRTTDPGLRLQAFLILSRCAEHNADFDHAEELLDRALELAVGRELGSLAGELHARRAFVRAARGALERAEEDVHAARALGEDAPLAVALIDAKRGHRAALEKVDASNRRARALVDALHARARAAEEPVYRASAEVGEEDADVAHWVARALE